MEVLCRLLTACFLLSIVSVLALSVSAQQRFPATAVIRGENVRLRAKPAEAAEALAYLQRGESVILTGPAVAADGDAFYPVDVPRLEQTGWVRQLFVNPSSIVAIEIATVTVEAPSSDDNATTEGESPKQRKRQREVRATDRAGSAQVEPTATPISAQTPAPTVVPTPVPAPLSPTPTSLPLTPPPIPPTPTPLPPTPTPLPATAPLPEAGVTAEEAAYATDMAAIFTVFTGSLTRLTALFEPPLLTDQDWQTDVAAELVIWQQIHEAAAALTPPASLANVHTLALEGLRLYSEAADDIAAGVNAMDEARLNQAIDKMTRAQGFINQAQDALDDFLRERGLSGGEIA